MTEIITDKEKWNKELELFRDSDFYHTFEYHQVSKAPEDKAVLFKFNENDVTIALPLLVRPIVKTPYFDATSVYGYPGPLIKSDSAIFDFRNFQKELNRYFVENNMVSVFSRLNPFVPSQEYIVSGLGNIVSPGNVVNIDLTQTPSNQLKQYHKRLRTYINKSRRNYDIKVGITDSEVARFIELYHENMRRVDAKPKYFFPPNYFYKLIESESFQTDLLMAIDNDSRQIVAGALFTKKNKIIQYHLSGVAEEYLKLNPIKLLIDEMRIRGTEEGFIYFNLGGGVANKEDSLFQFKQSFSNDIHPFNVWRYIVDPKIYNELVRAKDAELGLDSNTVCQDFFPCYRRESQVAHK